MCDIFLPRPSSSNKAHLAGVKSARSTAQALGLPSQAGKSTAPEAQMVNRREAWRRHVQFLHCCNLQSTETSLFVRDPFCSWIWLWAPISLWISCSESPLGSPQYSVPPWGLSMAETLQKWGVLAGHWQRGSAEPGAASLRIRHHPVPGPWGEGDWRHLRSPRNVSLVTVRGEPRSPVASYK